MSIKITKVFYPHIVKEYADIASLITENGYDDFYAQGRAILSNHIAIDDESVYREATTEDGFEGVYTIVFETQEAYDAYFAEASALYETELKHPIYDELVDTHLF